LSAKAIDGRPNPGRGVGMVAMALIVPTLGVFWLVVVRLYAELRMARLATQVCGATSALATLLLLTPFHDLAVEIGGGFGLAAFLTTLGALPRARHGFLFLGGAAAAAVSSVCFFVWRTGLLLPLLAPLQKLAFALFLAWVFVASLASARAGAARA
jgi:hypothetical protein